MAQQTTDKKTDTNKLTRSKSVQLFKQDKHEPFGNLSVDMIKAMLLDEDFAEMQSLFFYMMRDLKIASAVLTRSQQLIGQAFTIKTDNEAFQTWVAESVPLDELITQLASGIYYGVSLTNVNYDIADLKITPSFKHISPRYLYADTISDGGRIKTTLEHLYIRQNAKRIFLKSLDEQRIVFHKHPIDIGEITDFSLASKLVWYFSIKHLTMAHNLAYFDNAATPPLIAKSSGNEDELIDTLYSLKSSCVGVFDKDDVVEYLNVTSKADFLSFIEYIDRQIAILILGNTQSTSDGKNGSRAQSQVHENRQRDILKFDARLIEKTITGFLNRLEKLNFPNAKGCTFTFDIKQEKNLLDLSGVVKNLSDSGFELDDADIEAQFGFKIVGKKPVGAAPVAARTTNKTGSHKGSPNRIDSQPCPHCAPLQAHNNATQALHHEDELDKQTAAIRTAAMEKELLDGVFTIIANSTSYEEAYQSLLDHYPDMPLDKLDNALFQQTANSHLLAAAEIEDEANHG